MREKNIENVKSQIEVLHLPELRISSAALTKIVDNEGRYALLVNKNRAEKGEIILTPIGGAIETTRNGAEELKHLLGITDEAFEKKMDLRFRINGAMANEFRRWFLKRKNREIDPNREIFEELVNETGLLDIQDLKGSKYILSGYAAEFSETTRVGQEGQKTLRLLEIFDVQLKSEVLDKIKNCAQVPHTTLRFVTEEEMIRGETVDGIKIAEISKSLLNPQESIGEFG